jgi:hypothetical protein
MADLHAKYSLLEFTESTNGGDNNFMPITTSPRIESIIQSVHNEFGFKEGLFEPIAIRMDALDCAEFEATKVAGVYVFVHDDIGCIKVGKSQSNASKRALQHCGSDNTTSKDGKVRMAELDRGKTSLLIFALRKEDSTHWLLALEHYLEKTSNPRISSQRNG